MQLKKLVITSAALVATALVHLPDTASAGTRTWNLGAKGGYLFPGTATVDAGDFAGEMETEGGLAISLTGDALVAPRLSIGGFAFAAALDDVTVTTLGATIKGRFAASPTVELRPGIALGYQKIDVDGADGLTGLDVGGFVELAIPRPGSQTEWLVEVGFITQPAGGNSEADVTFGPILYVAAGIGYGN